MTPLLAIVLAWPDPYKPAESPEDYTARVGVIVASAEAADVPKEWPWTAEVLPEAELVVTWFESGRWLLTVHQGKRRGDHGRAWGLGQIQAGAWAGIEELTGSVGVDLEHTTRHMALVGRILARHAARCRVGPEPTEYQMARVMAAYGTGRCPGKPPRWATVRASMWGRLHRKAHDAHVRP